MKSKKQPTNEQIEVTNKAYKLRQKLHNDSELAELFGISKVTLYTRLKEHNWKKSEISFINNIYDFYFKSESNEKSTIA